MKKLFILIPCLAFLGCSAKKGSISGTVTSGGKGQKGAIVLAIKADSLVNGQDINYNDLKGTLVTSTDGSYKILLVDKGTYVVAAINDKNDNFTFEDSVDEFGYYGIRDTLPDSTIVVKPEKIIIDEGENKTGIDIDTLYILKH